MWVEPTKEEPKLQDPAEGVRKHYQSGQVGVQIPLLQAGVTGVLIGICVGTVSWAAGWGNPFVNALVTMTVIAAGMWIVLLQNWARIIQNLETALQMDINRDGQIGGTGQVEPETVRVELVSENRRHVERPLIPTTPAKLRKFAKGVLDGRPVTEEEWCGTGRLFSQNEFRGVRDIFIKQGWFAWKHPDYHNQGVEMLRVGRRVLEVVAHLDEGAPYPTEEGVREGGTVRTYAARTDGISKQ